MRNLKDVYFRRSNLYEENRKNRKSLSNKMAFAGSCCSCTDLYAGSFAEVSAGKLVYTVKFNNNSGTSKSKTYTALTRNVKLNTTIKLPAVPKAIGYQNLGWTTMKGSSKVVYKAGANIKVKKDMTLYAVRRKSKFYTVSFYLGNGRSTAAYRKLQKKVEEGTYYTLPAVPTRSSYVILDGLQP